ncbi:hypothetical protein N0V84_007068 [Fusarium piperis]|uniref:Uncharacterized protein n=1 Tax=Fusarium piperis TaxID=1435070 RepID=A0A9W9BMC8_9HYPO|nr:hypothetical protein N0V84_007068 [Fusarium piperis]
MARFSFSSILQGFYHAWQFIFTVILILIWIVAWLVQAGSIDMPEWTKDLRDQDEEDWRVVPLPISRPVHRRGDRAVEV